MRKLINKVIAVLAAIMMTSSSFLPVGVYAANEIKQNTDTNEENVKFSATINGENEAEAEIEKGASLDLSLSVLEAGYLRNIKVVLDGNNYSLGELTDDNARITEKNEIELNEVNSGKELEVKVPIVFSADEIFSEEDFSKESTVKLEAIYVNQNGKEINVEKPVTEKLTWKTNGSEVVSQKLIRYIKYENKTMVTFDIADGIKDNKLPLKNKELSIIVPKIDNKNPEKVIVNGNNIKDSYNNGVLTITKDMANEDGKYSWNSQDSYSVTYIYNNQTSAKTINTSIVAKATDIYNELQEVNSENNEFEIEDEVGSLVEAKVDGTEELNKGYMHTNTKREEDKLDTDFTTNYQINVGYADVLTKIVGKETLVEFTDEDDSTVKDATDSIKVNKVKVDKEELEKILGKDGTITVKDEEDNSLGNLTTDITELKVQARKISFETSEPVEEGIINLNVEKAIDGNSDNSKAEIDSYKKLKTTIEINGYSEESEISNNEVSKTIKLNEATSKASLEISTDRLSTIVKNENVVFNVVLNKKEISDALYTNPTIRIKLPEQIKNIEVLSGNLLYEDELVAGESEVNSNEIVVKLDGIQKQYNTSSAVDGALVRIETNLTLNNLAPSSQEKVELEVLNEYTGETYVESKELSIVAPTGFVTTNTIKVDNEEVTAVENDVELVKVKTSQDAKVMQVEANLVNNNGENADGLVVIGRIPTTGNKTVGGVELGTNINTTLATPVDLENLDNATVYYSNNIDETIDGNNWTTEANADTKSFKIVKEGTFEDKQIATFKYSVTIPENLDYELNAKENYGVYYNNGAQEGVTRNLVESKVVGITTGSAPDLKAEITAVDTNEGFEIENKGNVKEGEFVTYKLKLTNTGSNDANNVKVNTILSDALSFVEKEVVEGEVGNGYIINEENKNNEQELGTIKGGDSRTLYFDTVVTQKLELLESEENSNIEIGFSIDSDILEDKIEKIYSVKNNEGSVNAKLATNLSSSVGENEDYKYMLTVYNSNYTDKENVTATIKLPSGVKFDTIESGQKADYNERNNEVKVNIGEIQGGAEQVITIKVKNNSRDDELKAYATVKCDGMDKEIRSNEVVTGNLVTDRVLKITHSSNISGEILDSDKLEFYIDMKNYSKESIPLNVEDIVPSELRVSKYFIDVSGEEIYTGTTNYINSEITIPSGQSARVTIITEPFELEEGQKADIVNKPVITKRDGEEIKVDEIKVRVKGSREVEKEEAVEEGSEENSEVKEETKKYRITGTAWFDENKNGQRDAEEVRLKGIKLTLYSVATKDIVRDSNNKETVAITSENGDYAFSNIEAGEYVIASQYNSNEYLVTSYKEEGVQESINSDFVAVKVDGRDSATTDILKVEDENVYGIDLGLMPKDKFDLEITNNISKITVVNSENEKKEYVYDENTAKIELSDEEVNNSTLLIEYNINIRNNGNTEGYAKSIVNYIPDGLSFNSEYNKDWYLSRDGNLYTVSLANKKIQPGESENIKLVLVKKVEEDSIGIIRGRAEINSTYNEKGLAEINALSSRKANTSAADVIVARKTKVSALSTVSVTVGLITLFAIILYQMKKYIDSEYKIED